MKKIKLLILCIILITSCQKENIETKINKETVQKENELQDENANFLELVAITNNYQTSLEEAKELAISTATEMRTLEGISARKKLAISSIETITEGKKEKYDSSLKKRNTSKNTDMYLFNFSNNQGYVLVSADNRIPGILAYSSDGYLGDVIDNPGEIILLKRAHYLIKKKRKEFNAKKEKLIMNAKKNFLKKIPDRNFNINRILSYSNWTTNEKIGPLVRTLWSQGNSYNDHVSKKCNYGNFDYEAPVGCVAVAVGQIIAYHEKPKSFKGRHMNWNHMKRRSKGNLFSSIYTVTNKDAKEDIKHLLNKLGDKDLLDMKYDCKSSLSNSESAAKTFKKLGYSKVSYTDHNINKIISEIKQHRPIYIQGCSKRSKTTRLWPFREHKYGSYKYGGCHAWVLDGYVKRTRRVTGIFGSSKKTYSQNQELIHNNFGWGGNLRGNIKSYSGWYHKGLYDANNHADEVSNHSFRSGESNNYQFKNKIITIAK